MSFTTKIKRYIGDTSTLASGSVDTALSQAVDYTLGMVKSAAPMSMSLFANNFVVKAPMVGSVGPVTGLTITDDGDGEYTVGTTSVSFSGGGGTGASATVIEHPALGTIISITITNGGSGYTSAPTVSIQSDFGTGATATATITTVTAPLFNLRDRYIFDLLEIIREDVVAIPVPDKQKFAVQDSKSIYYAHKSSPVYSVDSNADLKIFPDTSSSANGSIHAVVSATGKTINDTNETIFDDAYTLLGASFVAKELFPQIWKELVVLHASELCLIEKLSDMVLQLPTDLDDTTVFDKIGDVDLTITGLTQALPTNFSQTVTMPTFSTVAFPSSEIGDPLSKAQVMIDGSGMGGGEENESAQYWLLDEDEDMVASTLSVAAQELNRANTILSEHQSELGNKVQVFNNEMTRYTSEIQKEAQRVQLDISEYQAELQDALQKKQNTLQEYTTNLGKKMSSYTTLIQKISTDYQWLTQQLQMITGKKQEFIQSVSSGGSSDSPQEKSI